jgi:hypothetical protein
MYGIRRSRIRVISVYILNDINRIVWECDGHGCDETSIEREFEAI